MLFAVFLGLPYVGLAILFAFYAGIAKQGSTTNNNNVSFEFYFLNFPIYIFNLKYYGTQDGALLSYNANQTLSPTMHIAKGTALSLTPSGYFQSGAGTTVYKNILQLSVNCPKYVDLDSVYDDSYIFFHGLLEHQDFSV